MSARQSSFRSKLWSLLGASTLMMVTAAVLAFTPGTGTKSARSLHSPAGLIGPILESTPGVLRFARPAGAGRALERAKVPLAFEENRGQSDGKVKYLARGGRYTLFLTSTRAVFSLASGPSASSRRGRLHNPDRAGRSAQNSVLSMTLVGASTARAMVPSGLQAGTSSYFIGKDQRNWHTSVPHYQRVTYEGVYPGIDLAYHGEQQEIEFDFIVKPGSDAGRIGLQFAGTQGINAEQSGDLVLSSSGGDLRLHKPLAYQMENGRRLPVDVRFALNGTKIGFALGPYDPIRELVIDPTLSYATYLGGSGADRGESIAVDANSNVYVTGATASPDFPGASGFGGGAHDIFVSKLDSSGALVYSAYVGGSGDEDGLGIAVDAAGNASVIGNTLSADFPATAGAFQTTENGAAQDAVVFQLDSSGTTLSYATYLGGSGTESGNAIAVDGTGNLYITGETNSPDFPTQNPVQAANAGATDAFVAKLNPQGAGAADLVYSTYLGGSGADTPTALALDSSHNAYIAGITLSTDLPVTGGAFQPTCGTDATCNTNQDDGFVGELNSTGSAVTYLTYLGGSSIDEPHGIAVDSTGAAYVTGRTGSADFPAAGTPAQAALSGFTDGFVAKVHAGGGALDYTTYLGGAGDETAFGITLDPSKNAYLTGMTDSADFPSTNGVSTSLTGTSDAFATELSASGSSYVFSTYLGGDSDEDALGGGIGLDPAGHVFVAGDTNSVTGFPLTSASQGTFGGGATDVFVAKYTQDTAALTVTVSGAGSGTVTSAPAGISCPGTCAANFNVATAVALTATPAAGSTFSSWGGACSGSGACNVTVNSATAVSAVFSLMDFQIAASALSPASVNAGSSSTSTITLTSVNGFNSAVPLACSGLPSGASCSFSPASVTPSAGGATSTLTISTAASTPVGTSTVSITGTSGSLSHSATVSLDVLAAPSADFEISATAISPFPVNAGGVGTSTITITPVGGFSGDVALGCGGAPQLATCTISPSPVTGGSGSATLTISTTPARESLLLPQGKSWGLLYASLLPLGGLLFAGVRLPKRRKLKRSLLSLALLGVTLCGVALLGSCGNNNHFQSGTPTGQYRITVTGTSGSVSHSTTVTLAVR